MEESNELSRKIKSLIEQQIQKLASLESKSISKEVKSCLSQEISIENIIQEKAEKGFSDRCPHSAYLSPPESDSDFGISITVIPCSLPDARKYFLREYPSLGFLGLMLEALDTVGCVADKLRGKKGVIFIAVCFSQPSQLDSVNLAISPISKEFGDIVPLVLPSELTPTDLPSDRKYKT